MAKPQNQVEVVPIREFDSYKRDWDRLSQELTNTHPLFDSSFVAPLIDSFANDDDKLAVVRSGDEATAILPLSRGTLSWQSWLPAQTQVSPVLIREIPSLFQFGPGVSLSFDLMCQDPRYSPWLDRLTHDYASTSLVHSTTMSIDLAGSFDDYWKQRSRNLRDNMKRKFKKPRKADVEVTMKVVTHPDDMRAAIEAYGELESAGWKAKQNTNVSINNKQGKFYLSVLTNFAEKQQAAVYELYLNENLGASKLTIANDLMIINLKKAYNESLSEFSPGRLLDYLQLKREFERKKHQVMEFYTNATRDQLSWSTNSRNIAHYTLFRNRPTALANRFRGYLKDLARKG
ncbi:MAG: GNAT family N-acetyltransferase [Pseudomonadota bacterium]